MNAYGQRTSIMCDDFCGAPCAHSPIGVVITGCLPSSAGFRSQKRTGWWPRKVRLRTHTPIKQRGKRGKRFASYVPDKAFQEYVRAQGCLLLREGAHHPDAGDLLAHARDDDVGRGADQGDQPSEQRAERQDLAGRPVDRALGDRCGTPLELGEHLESCTCCKRHRNAPTLSCWEAIG